MAQNIAGFYTALEAKDVARDFQFRVIQLGNIQFAEDELVYIKSAKLPGIEIVNHPVKYHGLSFNVPGTMTFPGSDKWSVKLFCDQAHSIRTKLMNAQRAIFDPIADVGHLQVPGREMIGEIHLLDETLSVVRKYKMIGLQIRSVGEIDYKIDGDGALLEFDATFSYHYWIEG